MEWGFWNISKPIDKNNVVWFNLLPSITIRWRNKKIIQIGLAWLSWAICLQEKNDGTLDICHKCKFYSLEKETYSTECSSCSVYCANLFEERETYSTECSSCSVYCANLFKERENE